MLRVALRKLSVATITLLFAACATPPAPPVAAISHPQTTPSPTATQVPKRLSADTPSTTTGGATFTAPAEWTLTTGPKLVVLESPEPDSHLAIVDVPAAQGADAAVVAAWTAYRADAKRTLKLATQRTGRKGWDERRNYTYETSPNEHASVYAFAFRKTDTWSVLIVDASDATFERRLSQVLLVLDSLRPKGYTRETFAGKKAHALDAGRIKKLGEFIETARAELGIPGVGMSLIDGGKVVFEGGFGVRELGKPKAVDADTLFLVASTTKGMTTLMLAKLVDEGKLRWDTPVTDLYPGFKLGDADTTSHVLLKHLVCACTGMPRQDLDWFFESKRATAKSEVELLRTMQPTTKFGEAFQYSNLLASVAGYVGGHALYPDRELGAAYDEAMRTRVFEPLGMKSTTFDFARAERGNQARPHGADVDGKTAVASMNANHSVFPIRPAGGAWASAHDLARYVQMELALGRLPDGTRYVSEENLVARRAPQVRMREDRTYGMGLIVDNTWGVQVVNHDGDMVGYKSEIFFLPEYGVGAVLATNADTGTLMLRPFMRRVLELLFDGIAEATEDIASLAQEDKAGLAKARESLTVPADPAVVAKLATRYTNAALGELTVRKEGAATVLDFGEWKSAVASRKNDDGTLSLVTIDPGFASDGYDFVVGEREGKRALIVRDAQHEYVFLAVN